MFLFLFVIETCKFGIDAGTMTEYNRSHYFKKRTFMKILLEISLIFVICLVGQAISAILPFPFPSSVLAMILLFLLLAVRLIKPTQIEKFSSFLLKNMAILFIPSGVGILESVHALQGNILPLLAVCVITTILTFAVTAFTVHGVIVLQQKLQKKKPTQSCVGKGNAVRGCND